MLEPVIERRRDAEVMVAQPARHFAAQELAVCRQRTLRMKSIPASVAEGDAERDALSGHEVTAVGGIGNRVERDLETVIIRGRGSRRVRQRNHARCGGVCAPFEREARGGGGDGEVALISVQRIARLRQSLSGESRARAITHRPAAGGDLAGDEATHKTVIEFAPVIVYSGVEEQRQANRRATVVSGDGEKDTRSLHPFRPAIEPLAGESPVQTLSPVFFNHLDSAPIESGKLAVVN